MYLFKQTRYQFEILKRNILNRTEFVLGHHELCGSESKTCFKSGLRYLSCLATSTLSYGTKTARALLPCTAYTSIRASANILQMSRADGVVVIATSLFPMVLGSIPACRRKSSFHKDPFLAAVVTERLGRVAIVDLTIANFG